MPRPCVRGRVLAAVFTLLGGVVLAACGKTGGTPHVAGVYHLLEGGEATSLELREDGTFTLLRESCASVGELECGEWKPDAAGNAHLTTRDGLYWPTPDAFPSTVFRALTIHEHDGDLLVVGESPWAGTFKQRWSRGRTCATCGSWEGRRGQRACEGPLPACIRL